MRPRTVSFPESISSSPGMRLECLPLEPPQTCFSSLEPSRHYQTFLYNTAQHGQEKWKLLGKWCQRIANLFLMVSQYQSLPTSSGVSFEGEIREWLQKLQGANKHLLYSNVVKMILIKGAWEWGHHHTQANICSFFHFGLHYYGSHTLVSCPDPPPRSGYETIHIHNDCQYTLCKKIESKLEPQPVNGTCVVECICDCVVLDNCV